MMTSVRLISITLTVAFVMSCHMDNESAWRKIADEQGHESLKAPPEHVGDAIAPPPFSPGIFPCSNCHAMMEPNPERRQLGMHGQIQIEHGPKERWCFDCHNPDDRDKLRLANGTLISFEESFRLCGQCHGPKLRDWRAGVHGKRTGSWNGDKQYRLCVNCHSPHAPRFKPMAPQPIPVRPDQSGRVTPPEFEHHQANGNLDVNRTVTE